MGATFAIVASIVSAVTSVVSLAMTLSMDGPKVSDSGTSIDRKGIDNPKLVPFGTTRVPCSRVWSNVQNSNTRWLAQQYAISIGQIKQVHNIYIDEVAYFSGQPNADYWYDIKTSNEFPNACMGIRLGKETEQAWQQIISHSDGEWSAEHRGDRTASIALLIERWINKENDNDIRIMSDRLKIEVLVDGVAVIDPRYDLALEGAVNWKQRSWVNGQSQSFQNPACVLLTYLVDSYYGMGLPVECIDVQSFIELANYCENAGIKFNGYVDQESDFGKTLIDMANSFDGIVYLEDGLVKVKADRYALPVVDITESDCVGSFKLSNINDSSYYNIVNVDFINADTSYSKDKYVLPANVLTDARIQRDGFEKTKNITLNYTSEAVGDNFVKIIANKYLKRVDYQKTIEFDLDNTKKILRLYDVFTITNSAYKLNKKQFRVDSIQTSLDDKTMISRITATEYEVSVYDASSYEDGNTSKPVLPPTLVVLSPVGLAFNQTDYTTSGSGRLSWTSRYQKEHRTVVEYKLKSANDWSRVGDVKGDHYDFTNLRPDTYDFRVMTRSFMGSTSNWSVLSNIKINGGVRLPQVTGLKSSFTGVDCIIEWNDMKPVKIESNSPVSSGVYTVGDLFSHYEIIVYKGANNTYAETLSSATNKFVYTFDFNDKTTVNRDLRFEVKIVARDGSESAGATVDAYNNQAPQPVAVEVDGVLVNLAVKWDHPNITDYAATEVHISNVAGFIPSIDTLAATSVSPFITINRQYNGVHYCRIGHRDVFGNDGIAWSAPVTFTMKDIDDVLEDSPLFDTAIGDLNDAINNGLGDLTNDLNSAVGDLNASIDGVVGDLNTNVGNLTDKINQTSKDLTVNINAQIAGVSADILENAKAIASNKSTIGTQGSQINQNKTAISGVAGNLASFENETTVNFENANAAISSNQTAIANTNQALTTYKIQVTTKFEDVEAGIVENSQAVADANQAIANQNSALTAKIDKNTASISTNKTAIADTKQSVTSLQNSVNAKFDEVEADITSNSNAIATANQAIVNQGNSLTAEINKNKANIISNSTAISDTNKTVASLSSTVTSNYNGLNSKIASNTTAISDASKTIANINTSLTAKINDNAADIASNSTTIADTNRTLSSLSSTVTSNYNGLNSKITSNTTAISGANKTIANINSSLTAAINANKANIASNSTAIADNEKTIGSLSTTVSSNFNTLNGKITQNATSISNTNKTVSTLNSTVTANYGDLNGKISSTNTVVAGIDGRVTATTNLAQTVNGKTSGLIMVNDGNVAKTAIIADKFLISGEAGGQAVFQVVNGVASMRNALIKDLTATNIRAGSITGHSISTGTTVRAGSGAYTAGMNGDHNWKHESFWAGSDNPTTAPFRVMRDGSIYATKANITGHIVANSGTFKGHVEAASGKFKGHVEATSGSFTGAIHATSGSISGNLISGEITAGTIRVKKLIGDVTALKGYTASAFDRNIGFGAETEIGRFWVRGGSDYDFERTVIIQNGWNAYARGMSYQRWAELRVILDNGAVIYSVRNTTPRDHETLFMSVPQQEFTIPSRYQGNVRILVKGQTDRWTRSATSYPLVNIFKKSDQLG